MRKQILIYLRRLSQTMFFSAIIYSIWSTKYPLNNTLNPSIYFKLDPFIMLATALAERIFLGGIFYTLIVLGLTIVFGRAFCGWFCPLGAIQDLMAYVLNIIKMSHIKLRPAKLSACKYFILVSVFALALIGVQVAWAIDPIAIFVRVFSLNIFPFINRLIDGTFIFVINNIENPDLIEQTYYYIKDNLIALNNPIFPQSGVIFILLIIILVAVVWNRRFWCRYICPLGALLAIISRFSILERYSGSCKDTCSLCMAKCRMNAINSDNTYLKDECVLCMDCTNMCHDGRSKFMFGWKKVRSDKPFNDKGITRAQFLLYISGILSFIPISRFFGAAGTTKYKYMVIRPPASLPEEKFIQRCIRCGNCMKVCPTNVLQPAILEAGPSGVWTPKLDTGIGYCEYKCNLCGSVCPTSAIESITVEQKIGRKIGLAEIDQRLCLPWAKGTECIVCEEHCPIADKAIKLTEIKGKDGKVLKLPCIDPYLCVGCAICEFKCPVTPSKAIRIKPL